ncbi:MAG: hypothetical protein IPP46_03585 [Bacteroidetes bacterium]|nr:hypothetical protein [Bacteroidota bacterium]
MCGIAGFLNSNNMPADASVVKSMLEKIKHRGPDGEGVYCKHHIGMGHKRLAILDLTAAGAQPMTSEDEMVTITYNGEIIIVKNCARSCQLGYTFQITFRYRGDIKRISGMGHCRIRETKRDVCS